jgi:hypothetical protein
VNDDYDGARSMLERSIATLESIDRSHPFASATGERARRLRALAPRLPDAELALAKALPPSAAPRAVELARSARAGYERQKGYPKPELAEVDAWLREHQRDAPTK